MLSNEFRSALEKRALGFSYEEVVYEYEKSDPGKFLYCEKQNKIKTNVGYIKTKKVLKKDKFVGLEIKKIKKFLIAPKSFKLKGKLTLV